VGLCRPLITTMDWRKQQLLSPVRSLTLKNNYMKFFFLGLSICLIIVVLYRVIINNELLSDSYYRLIIAFGCLIAWLIIIFVEKRKSRQ